METELPLAEDVEVYSSFGKTFGGRLLLSIVPQVEVFVCIVLKVVVSFFERAERRTHFWNTFFTGSVGKIMQSHWRQTGELIGGSLLAVRKGTLQVIHLTVKEFLRATDGPRNSPHAELLVDPRQASMTLTHVCLKV